MTPDLNGPEVMFRTALGIGCLALLIVVVALLTALRLLAPVERRRQHGAASIPEFTHPAVPVLALVSPGSRYRTGIRLSRVGHMEAPPSHAPKHLLRSVESAAKIEADPRQDLAGKSTNACL